VPIVVLGTDALLAALPATPVQLAHGCLRAGFANAIPASWGDELIATAVLRRLPQFGSGPAIQCSCPIVAHRLLSAGGDLRPVLLPLVSPPVAIARYVRELAKPAKTRITYVGACPGAIDDSIDIRMSPESLIAMLGERDIVLEEQPRVFESIIPPDRRRYRSQPGGVPTADALWTELGSRALVEIESDDFITEIAQHLLAGKNVLIDAATRLGCACSGAAKGARRSREEIVALEPPRSVAPVVDERPSIDLDMPVPAAPRTPVDVIAVPTTPRSMPIVTPPGGADVPFGNRISPVRASGPVIEPRPSPRPSTPMSSPVVPRPVLSSFPVTREVEGKSLPRTYITRRRSSPKGISVTLPPEDPPKDPPKAAEPPHAERPRQSEPVPAKPARPSASHGLPAVSLSPSADRETSSPARPTPAPTPEPVAVATPPAAMPAPVPTSAPAVAAVDPTPARRHSPAEGWGPPPPAVISRGQVVFILIAVAMIAICASTVVGVIVSRSVTSSSISAR
jgi:hypothetical protein